MENNMPQFNDLDDMQHMHTFVSDEEYADLEMSNIVCSTQSKCACKCVCMPNSDRLHDFFLCKEGFSMRQINILSIIKRNRIPMSFKHISEVLTAYFNIPSSPDAVRGVVQRMKQRKLISAKFSRHGYLSGNVYSLSPRICKNIPPFMTQEDVHIETRNSMQDDHSFKDRIDRNINLSDFNGKDFGFQHKILNHEKRGSCDFAEAVFTVFSHSSKQKLLNLTDDEIAFRWENLSKYGFGRLQIKQIIEKLESQGSSLEHVMQGLNHAEWDLEHEQMRDKQGELIKSPLNWVYMILAKQGYYPRPKNYISPVEQAEKDCQAEIVALEKAKANQEESAFQKWCANFSEEEKTQLIKNKTSTMTRLEKAVPPRIILKQCYADFLKSKEVIL